MDLLSSGRGTAGKRTDSDGKKMGKDEGSNPEYNKEELEEVGETSGRREKVHRLIENSGRNMRWRGKKGRGIKMKREYRLMKNDIPRNR